MLRLVSSDAGLSRNADACVLRGSSRLELAVAVVGESAATSVEANPSTLIFEARQDAKLMVVLEARKRCKQDWHVNLSTASPLRDLPTTANASKIFEP